MKLFRVHWRSLRTGASGKSGGTWPQASAQAWADELNARPQNINLKHWIEPAENQ